MGLCSGVQEFGGYFLGVPMIRLIVYGSILGSPDFGRLPFVVGVA